MNLYHISLYLGKEHYLVAESMEAALKRANEKWSNKKVVSIKLIENSVD